MRGVRRHHMRYRDFIAELRALVDEAERIRGSGANHETPAFRDWRHRSQSLVNEAKALGYRLPGEFRSSIRAYRAMYSNASKKDDAAAFSKELGDSTIELRHFIAQYDKYGEPKSVQLVGELHSQPVVPERVTLAWLFKNVPVTLWFSGLGVVGGAFLLGVAVGRTNAYMAFEQWFKSLLWGS